MSENRLKLAKQPDKQPNVFVFKSALYKILLRLNRSSNPIIQEAARFDIFLKRCISGLILKEISVQINY